MVHCRVESDARPRPAWAGWLLLALLLSLSAACARQREGGPIGEFAIAPDGDGYILRYRQDKESRLVSYSARSGIVRALPQPANEHWASPVFSPDGKWIAVAVCDVDEQRLVNHTTARIDIMRPDGSGRRTVVPADGRVTGPFTFSPDGGRILFSKGHARETRRPVDFDIYESDLASGRASVVVPGKFYQLSSVAYLGQQYAYVGDGPRNYLWDYQPPPREYNAHADEQQKMKWEMASNSMLYISSTQPQELAPAVRFQANGGTLLAWSQVREIERLRVAPENRRMFVAMRHPDHPPGKRFTHFTRDVFEMEGEGTFRRLTWFNTVQFQGFDVTPDGRYVAVVPTPGGYAGTRPGEIYRIESATGAVTVHVPNFSNILSPDEADKSVAGAAKRGAQR